MAELCDSLAGLARFTHHFLQYLIAFCSRPEASSGIISGSNVCHVGVDVLVKFGDVLEKYDIEALGGGIFDRLLNFDNCQPEEGSDVRSRANIDQNGVKVCVTFCESGSNRSRDVRLPQGFLASCSNFAIAI